MKKKCTVKQINEDTWRIRENVGAGVFMFLLAGEDKALLIDNGYGTLDLKNVAKELCGGKELLSCVTHGHIDHALGSPQLETVYCHSADFALYEETLAGDEWRTVMAEAGQPVSGEVPNRLLPLESVDALDLGGRTVRWFPVPGHTAGSVVFYDEKYNVIFDGDSAPNMAWLFLEESRPLVEYAESLKRYIAFMKECGVEKRYICHMDKVMTVRDAEKLLRCAELALEGKRKTFRIDFGDGYASDVILYRGEFLCFDKKKL